MPTQEEILLTILGRDEASPVFNQISNNAQSMGSSIANAGSDGAKSLANSYMDAISGVSSAFSQLNVGMMSLNSVSHQVLSTLGTAKSASDLVFGTSSKAETNKVLVKGWGDAKVSAEELYDTVDQVTDKSLTSMQDLIPAMNAFRAATGATGTELKESVAENMAQFGAYVLSLTGSEALAHTAMSDLSKGIKGRWASLDQYGVSEDALKMTGKWSGDEDDIKGYMEAVREVSGAVEELMQTSQGTDALLGKMWSRAGKRLGNEYLPGITSIKNAFMALDRELEGNLSTSILAVSLAIEEVSGMAYKFSTLINGFRDISKVVYTAGQYLGFFGSVMSVDEELQYYSAMATQQNTQEVDNNTMARYDNIDAMYQQADAMAMLNDTTAVNDAMTAENTLLQSTNIPGKVESNLPTAGGGIDAVRNSDIVKDNVKNSSKIKQTNDEIDALNDLNKSYNVQRQILGDVEQNVINRNKALEELNKLDDRFLPEGVSKSRLMDFWQIQADVENKATDWDKSISPIPSTMDKFGPKMPNLPSSQFDNRTQGATNVSSFKELIESNDEARKQAGELRKSLKSYEDTIEEIDLSDKPFTRFKNKLTNAFGRKHNYSEDVNNIENNITNPLRSVSNKLTTSARSIRSNLGTAFNNFRTTLEGIKAEGVEGNLNNLFNRLGNAFKGIGKNKEVVEGIDEAVDGVSDVVKGGSKVAEAGATAGAVAPEMAEASAGLSFMGLAEMGLAGAFTTLIVPTLAIAGVIAILIPIIAGLTIEAMFFLKIIQQFFVSMNFGGINMEDSIEGIKQLATGLGYVALAMGALLAVNIVTTIMGPFIMIGNIFGGGLTGALDVAVTSLKQASEKIEEFSNIEINEDIAINLENLGNALNGISKAMLGLAGIQITTGITGFLENVFNLGSVSEALDSAKNDIIEASGKLQEFSNVTPIDDATAQKIQNVCETLGSVGDAFSGLQKIRDSQNFDILGGLANLFGGVNITQALQGAHQTIVDASKALQGFSDVEAIDEGVVENIKNVATSLSSIGEAVTALQSLRDTFNGANLQGGEQKISFAGFDLIKTQIPSVLDSLKDVRNIIVTASKGLTGFSDMPDIASLKIGDKITAFVEVLNGISSATESMTNIRKVTVGKDLNDTVLQIRDVRRSIITVGKGLTSLQDVPDLKELGVASKIKSVTSVLSKVTEAVESMKGVHGLTKGADLTKITLDIREARRAIITVSQGLKGMATDPNFSSIDEGLSGKIKSVGDAVKTLKTATSQFTGFPSVNVDDIKTKTDNAVQAVKSASSNLRNITSEDKVGKAVTSSISSVNTGVKKLKTVTKSFTTLPNVSPQTIGNKVKNGVDAVKKTSEELKNLNAGDKVSGISGILNNVKNAISSLRKTLKESTNFNSEGKSIGSSLKTGVKGGLSGINTTVNTPLISAFNLGKANAFTYGKGIGGRLKAGFAITGKISTEMQSEMNAVKSAIDGSTPGIVGAIGQLASEMVDEFNSKSGRASPGHMARAMGYEMNDMTTFVNRNGRNTINAVGTVARRMVANFNPNLARNINPSQVMNRVNSLRNMNRNSELGRTQRPVNISIGSGAIQLDARNMTTKESRQIMINALEGLDAVSGIQINGS